MRLMNVAAILAAGMMMAGCETTGAGISGMGGIPPGTAFTGASGTAATPAAAAAPAAGTGIPDAQKSCEQLAAEIGEQQQIIAAANDSATNAQMVNAGVGIAQSLGMHFGGFGLGGIQAAGAAGNAAAQQGQAAQQQAQQAEIRLQVLGGFHQGKGCAA